MPPPSLFHTTRRGPCFNQSSSRDPSRPQSGERRDVPRQRSCYSMRLQMRAAALIRRHMQLSRIVKHPAESNLFVAGRLCRTLSSGTQDRAIRGLIQTLLLGFYPRRSRILERVKRALKGVGERRCSLGGMMPSTSVLRLFKQRECKHSSASLLPK
jgi:hypothetical protein